MRTSFYSAFFLIFFLTFSTRSFSQGSIKGKLIDSVTRKPLTLATLTVLKKADTSLLTYRLSDPSGNFRVPGIPLNTACYIVVSFIGYEVLRKDLDLTSNTPLDLGTLALQTTTRTLDEALVIAERPPVRVYKDTIEFNAASFRMLPDALVEDLLRKLPGVDVDKEGNIMVNGKVVNRILVDGKYFFGDDPKMATRNLPANSIDKVQVTDDKEQIDRSTDGDMTRIGKVINLTLKKSIKKGWFGKTYAGGGTDNRYQAGGIANIYRDTLQLSLLGFSNNINAGGFTIQDITGMGGFKPNNINSISINKSGGSEGIALNGISFGGGGAGDNRSTGVGFNLNHTPGKKMAIYIQYFFGYNNSNLQTLNQNQQFINDTSITGLTLTNSTKDLFSHVANIGMNYHPDNLTDLSFRASGNYSSTHVDAGSVINTTNNKLGTVNSGNGNLLTNQYTGAYSHDLRLTRKYKGKPGRILNLSQTVQYQSNLLRYTTFSDNIYFYPDPDTLLFDQLRRQTSPNLSAVAALGFVDPLSKHWTLRLNANYQYLRDQYGVGIYDNDPLTGQYDHLQLNLSNGYRRVQHTGFANALLAWSFKKLTVTGGFAAESRQIANTYDKTTQPVNFSLFNLLPSLSVNWGKYSAQYNETITVPDISYLSPVPDSTNPFYIVRGNPTLQPGKKHSVSVNYFSFNPRNNVRANFYIRGSIANNDVILARTVSTTGVQSVLPVNVNDSRQASFGGSIGRDFRNRHFIFSVRFNPTLTLSRQQLRVNDNSSIASGLETGPKISVGFNWSDKVEINPDYSYIVSSTHYTDPSFTNIRVNTHQLQTDIIVRAPGKLIWETKLLYRYSSEVVPGLPRASTLLNIAVGYPVLAHNKGQLKFNAYNLLNQNINISAYTSGNSIINQRTNTLNRYFMLTFTYNIQNFRPEKSDPQGKQRLFQF